MRVALAIGALVVSTAAAVHAQGGEEPPASRPDPLFREARVPLKAGRVSTRDLVVGLLEAYQLDLGDLRIPDKKIRVTGWRGYAKLAAVRKLLRDAVSFRQSSDRTQLVITIDREKARAARREIRGRIALVIGKLAGRDLSQREYRLDLPDPLRRGEPLVLFVHGVESGAHEWEELRAYLDGHPSALQHGAFIYPNDDSIESTAAALSEKLKELEGIGIYVVGHSMGGLVARALVELPTLDPGNVDLVIQIGTPNRGSYLASLRFALEAKQMARDGGDLAAYLGTLIDGLGEAQGDLLPRSVFLTKLNAQPRNPRVRYRMVLGTGAPLQPEQWKALRTKLLALTDRVPGSEVFEERLAEILADLDEVVRGQGDGAVSVERGRLPGVEPVLVPRGHVGLVKLDGPLSRRVDAASHPVWAQVLRWVEEEKERKR